MNFICLQVRFPYQGSADYLREPRAGHEQDVGWYFLRGVAGRDTAESVVVDAEVSEKIKDRSLRSLKDTG